jgi:hypothetical protein
VLGLEFTTQAADVGEIRMQMYDRTLTFPDIFFAAHANDWLQRLDMPAIPLKTWPHDIVAESATPILYGDNTRTSHLNRLCLGLDIVGSTFFMLSRYEELVTPTRDEHDRFPASASLALKAGFLDRPIVDEYIEILWRNMQALWPNLERRQRQGRVIVSCDVDHPYDANATHIGASARAVAADLLKRRNPSLALKRLRNIAGARRGDYRHDPNNTFDWYMDDCEERGHRAVFYFIAGHSGGAIDGSYELGETYVQQLLRRISQRGHDIGVHSSYNTYCNAREAALERNAMIKACEMAHANASVSGNRQHYLRWSSEHTPDVLDAAGYDYDSTGAFADHPGFRYGTAHTFAMWSWPQNKPLRLKQSPLIMMESSIIAQRYLGLGYSDAATQLMQTLKQRALRHGGNFVLLWHNSHFTCHTDRRFFCELLA